MQMETPPLSTPDESWQNQVLGYLIPLFLALIAGTGLIMYLGENPLEVYRLLIWGGHSAV